MNSARPVARRPDPWAWARLVLLGLGVLAAGFFPLATVLDGGDRGPAWVWSLLLLGAAGWLALGRSRLAAASLFLGLYLTGSAVVDFGGLYESAHLGAWILGMVVLADVNSRRPRWFGWVALAVLLLAVVAVAGRVADSPVPPGLGLVIAALAGRLVGSLEAAARLREAAAEDRRRVDRLELTQAVHDSGAARLAQLLLLARALLDRPNLPDDVRGDVELMVEVASAGAKELRSVVVTGMEAGTPVADEWRRATDVLASAGFQVLQTSDPLPSLPPEVEQEAVRVIREATSNICRHAVPRGRILASAAVRDDELTLRWVSEAAATAPRTDGMGLAGMRRRVERLGGSFRATGEADAHHLRVSLPMGARL